MTDWPRPVFDVVHSGSPRGCPPPFRRRARHAGFVVLAALLTASMAPLGGTVPRSGHVSGETRPVGEIAENERGRDSWSRLGDLVNDVIRNARQDHPDRAPDAREPVPQHLVAPVPKDAPPLNRRDHGR